MGSFKMCESVHVMTPVADLAAAAQHWPMSKAIYERNLRP
jgi:hypothetical protein